MCGACKVGLIEGNRPHMRMHFVAVSHRLPVLKVFMAGKRQGVGRVSVWCRVCVVRGVLVGVGVVCGVCEALCQGVGGARTVPWCHVGFSCAVLCCAPWRVLAVHPGVCLCCCTPAATGGARVGCCVCACVALPEYEQRWQKLDGGAAARAAPRGVGLETVM